MTNNKFKAGDKVKENWDWSPRYGEVFTVTKVEGDTVWYDRDDRSRATKDNFTLVEPVCTCEPCSTCDEIDPADEDSETFYFSYTFESDSGTDTASASLRGDKAGELEHVLDVFRCFLQRSGFSYVGEVNAVTEDGTWHSSSFAE